MTPIHRFPGAIALILSAFSIGACSGDSPSMPMGPSAMASGPGGMGMPGMGMSAPVASEFDYLSRMIPHHEEAIATAQLLERGTARPEMRDFARAIVGGQSAEVAQMRAWLAAWYPGRDITVPYEPMMRDLTALRGAPLDQAFLTDMIPHHMMAVMMSQQLAAGGFVVHPDVAPFARTIRDVQQDEIRMMQAWLRAWFG